LESEHGITCKCGQTFKTSEEHTKHVAIQRVLDEVKRIGGEKFYKVAKKWEDDAHSGDLREFAANHDLELRPENATRIAKKEIIHMVQHFEEYHIDGYQDEEGGPE
jgi:hypothetical protein